MGTLRFYGASDDLLEVEGDFEEEYPAHGHTFVTVHAPDGTFVEVHAEHGNTGWFVGLGGLDEDDIWPDWGFRYLNPATHGSGYSPVLEITVPDGFRVEGDNGCGD